MELDRLDDIEGVESELLPEPLYDASEFTYDEALELTKSIKSTITAAWVLLGRAHEGKAYRALGYKTWEEYVRTEFDFSVRTSYRLLDKAEVVRALEQASPADTAIQLTNKQVQEIKRELPKIVERVQQETTGKTPEAAAEIVENIITPSPHPQPEPPAHAEKKTPEEISQELEDEADKILENSAVGDYSAYSAVRHPPAPASEPAESKEEKDSSSTIPGEHAIPGPPAFGDPTPFAAMTTADTTGEKPSNNDPEPQETDHAKEAEVDMFCLYAFLNNIAAAPLPEEAIHLVPPEREEETIITVQAIKLWSEIFLEAWYDEHPDTDYEKLMSE